MKRLLALALALAPLAPSAGEGTWTCDAFPSEARHGFHHGVELRPAAPTRR